MALVQPAWSEMTKYPRKIVCLKMNVKIEIVLNNKRVHTYIIKTYPPVYENMLQEDKP